MKAPLHLLILGALLCGTLLPETANGQLDFLREWFGDLFGLSSDSSSSSPSPTDEDPHVSSSSIDSREIEEQVSSVLWGLDGRLEELLRDMGNFTRPLSEVSFWCYEPSLGGEKGEGDEPESGSSVMMMNIFNGSARFRTVAVDYYVSREKFCFFT